MSGFLIETITVSSIESGLYGGKWKLSGILNRMQNLAESHANVLKCGRSDMVDTKGFVWLLMRLHLRMDKYPKIAQKVKLTTFFRQPERIVFPRCFLIEGENGEKLGACTTEWVLYNIRDKKIERPSALGTEYIHDISFSPASREPLKLRPQSEGMSLVEKRSVRFSDCDMNMHMNNARYADWICDAVEDKISGGDIFEFDITYTREARPKEEIAIFISDSDKETYIEGKAGGENIFMSKILFR